MPRGVRSTESYADWARRQPPTHCACGCGGEIRLTETHRKKNRIPRFLRGHSRGGGLRPWIQQSSTILCACGCNGSIQLTEQHRWNRLPRFLPGHNAKTGFEQWANEQRNKHFCACGCGEALKPTRQYRRNGFPAYKRGHRLRVTHPRDKDTRGWVKSQQGRHFCEYGCGRTITIWPTYRWAGIPKMCRECNARNRTGENHPSWVADRSKVVGGRGGRYFLPRIKQAVLARDGHQCRVCKSSRNLAVDHIVPVWEGGPGTLENGQALCVDCHETKTRIDRARYYEHKRQQRTNGGSDANSGHATQLP